MLPWLPHTCVSSDHELSVLTSMSFEITEPSQSCSSGYLRLKDLYSSKFKMLILLTDVHTFKFFQCLFLELILVIHQLKTTNYHLHCS